MEFQGLKTRAHVRLILARSTLWEPGLWKAQSECGVIDVGCRPRPHMEVTLPPLSYSGTLKSEASSFQRTVPAISQALEDERNAKETCSHTEARGRVITNRSRSSHCARAAPNMYLTEDSVGYRHRSYEALSCPGGHFGNLQGGMWE